MEFTNKDDTERFSVMDLSRRFDENLGDMYRAGDCGTLHYDVASRPKDEEGSMQFKLEIIRVGNWILILCFRAS